MGQISLNIPQTGQPNATQDPLVAANFSTIQTWANGNVEATNLLPASGIAVLKPTSKSGNYTAAAGDLIRATAALTVTLPGHSAGQLVGIVSQVSSGVVTVSGTNINGVGLQSASSFTLGTYGAFALLEDNGSDWSIISGQQDTGWQTVTLGTGVTAATGSYTPGARLRNDTVQLRGTLNASAGFPSPTVTIPAGLRPTNTGGVYLTAYEPAVSNGYQVFISSAGALVPSVLGGGAAATVSLDGLTYTL